MYVFLRIIRGIFGFVAAWQILGLLPVIGWLQNLGSVTGGMWAIAFVKFLLLLVFGAFFLSLRTLINKLHTNKHGSLHPALSGRWSL